MTNLTDEELFHLNRRGLIPGPGENEADFIKRARYCLPLKKTMDSLLGDQQKHFRHDPLSDNLLQEAFEQTVDLYDIQPTWIPLFFSNYKLLPWHGGCAWIFQHTEESPTAAFMQLRQNFRRTDRYLSIYSRKELIAHELAHVGRMAFQEPKFEEILAYRTSKSGFRRFLGPLIQAPWECALFIFTLLFIFILDLALLATGLPHAMLAMLWVKIIPLGMILYALARRSRRQMQFMKCLNKLREYLGSRQTANAVIYRLQDEEIKLFGKMTKEEMKHYLEINRNKSPRWRLLALAYFNRL